MVPSLGEQVEVELAERRPGSIRIIEAERRNLALALVHGLEAIVGGGLVDRPFENPSRMDADHVSDIGRRRRTREELH